MNIFCLDYCSIAKTMPYPSEFPAVNKMPAPNEHLINVCLN